MFDGWLLSQLITVSLALDVLIDALTSKETMNEVEKQSFLDAQDLKARVQIVKMERFKELVP